MICALYDFGNNFDENGNLRLTNKHLRGMYIEDIVNDRYNKIHNGVIENAIKGKTNVDFTIMCIRNQHMICDNYDGFKEWWRQYILRNGGEQLPNIQSEKIKTRVIEKLQNVFPDSNITKGYKNCCDTYNITW
jgi:hypothetical protein